MSNYARFIFLSLQQPSYSLAGMVAVIAFLYSSVGFGGATGYLAAMSLFDVPVNIAASTALTLNLIVAGIAFVNFYRSGHLDTSLLWPFVVASIPAAFIGGSLKVSQNFYQALLSIVLLYVAVRLLLPSPQAKDQELRPPPPIAVFLIIGAGLGLLSGIIGIGGGVFLSPLIILSGWANAKRASASAAGFILLNSLSGLIGRAWSGTLEVGEFGLWLIPIGILFSAGGSSLGAKYLSGKAVRKLLGVVLLIAVSRSVIAWLR